MKEKNIIRQVEYENQDSYVYVVRDKRTNKILVLEPSEEEAEKKLAEIMEREEVIKQLEEAVKMITGGGNGRRVLQQLIDKLKQCQK